MPIDAFQVEQSWSGNALKDMLLRTVIPGDTIEKEVAMILEGSKISRNMISIPRFETSVTFQPYNPNPTGNGQVIVDKKVLNLETKFQDVKNYNPQDFEEHFFEQYYPEERIDDETLPEIVQAKFVEQEMARLQENFENGYWRSRIEYGQGVTPASKGSPDNIETTMGLQFWDGFIKKALEDATTQWVSYNPANYTVDNIRLNVFDAMINTMISNEISKALAYKFGPMGTNLLLSYEDQSTYEQALIQDLYKSIDSTETAPDRFRQYNIKRLAGLPANTSFLSTTRPDTYGNFFIGINSDEDAMLEMKRNAYPSDIWTLKATFKCDVTHGWGDQLIGCTSFIN